MDEVNGKTFPAKGSAMESDNMLVVVAQWLWVLLVGVIARIWSKLAKIEQDISSIDTRVTVNSHQLINEKERRGEILEKLKEQDQTLHEHGVQLATHNQAVMTALKDLKKSVDQKH